MPKVRTTMNPLVELDVTEREANDLARMGVLLDSTATTRDALLADALAQSVEREGPSDINADEPAVENLTTVAGNLPDVNVDDEDTDPADDDVDDDDEDTDVDDDAADEADTERRVAGLLSPTNEKE